MQKFVRCSLCVTKKYVDLERVDFIKQFLLLLRKAGQTQTWHKTMKCKNYVVLTFGVFHSHENRV